MRALLLPDKARIIDTIPALTPALFCPGLHGRGSYLLDRSKNANHGTLSAATWDRTPRGLLCSKFNGTSGHIVFTTGTPLQFNLADFTISIWVKDTNTTLDSAILSKGYAQAGYNGNWILRSHKTNGLEFYVYNGTTPVNTTFKWTGFAAIRASWNKVTITRSAGALTMIVNGVSRATATIAVNIGNNTYNMWLGRTPSSATEYLKGNAHYLYVLNQAVSVAADLARYNRERHWFGV